MDKIDDGGQAFPDVVSKFDTDFHAYEVYSLGGMSLRDYFAGQALTGILSGSFKNGSQDCSPERKAELAYGLADAMIAKKRKDEA